MNSPVNNVPKERRDSTMDWIKAVGRRIVFIVLVLTVWGRGAAGISQDIVIGTEDNYPPYSWRDEHGQMQGFNIDLTQAIARKLGMKIEFRMGPWNEIRQALEKGEIDAVAGMYYSPERDSVVDFSASITKVHHAIFTLENQAYPRDLYELKGLNVVVIRGDIMHDYLEKHQLADQVILAESPAEVMQWLDSGQYDCALMAHLPGLYWIDKLNLKNLHATNYEIMTQSYCFAVTEGHHALQNDLNEGLALVSQSGEYQAIFDRWLGVHEPFRMTPRQWLKYSVMGGGLVLLLAGVFGLFIYHMRRTVRIRTASLQEEIEHRKKIQVELNENQEILQTIYDGVQDVLSIMKPDHTILSYNQAGYKLLNMNAQEVIGRKCYELIGRARPCDICAAIEVKKSKRAETVMKFVPERGLWIEATAIPVLNQDGQIELIVEQLRDITQKKLMDDKLRQAYEIIDHSPYTAFIWRNEVGWPTEYVSENVLKLLGCPAEEFINGEREYYRMIHPDDLDEVVRQLNVHDWSSPLTHKPYRIYNHIGRIMWIESRITVRRDSEGVITHYEGIVCDISDRIAIEQKYRETQDKLAGILGAIVAGICMIDHNYQVVWANERFIELFGPDSIGTRCYEFHHGRQSNCETCPVCDTMTDNQIHTCEKILKISDGRERVFLCTSNIAEVNERGDPELIVEVLVDITDQKNIEHRLVQSQQETQHINEQLENAIERANIMAQEAVVASQAKTQFLANMSHEIRTPMNAIVGFGELLALEKLNDEQCEYVDIIRESGNHLLGLINDILDFSKVEADRIELEMVEVDLHEVFDRLTAMLKHKAREKGLEFTVQAEPQCPARFLSDPVRLQQCLINLVSNAIKFTRQGFVRATVRHVTDGSQGDRLLFEVSDSGIGIDPEKQQVIFEPFVQADSSTTRTFGGTGLGLSLTRRLAELLGGSISLRSQTGQGSTFILSLPCHPVVTGDPKAKTEIDVEKKPAGLQQDYPQLIGRILVAEDNPANSLLIKKMLSRFGLEPELVTNGRDAVERIREMGYDLVFMDMQMPEMNGYDATETLRQNKIRIPIIALTANVMQDDKTKCLEAGCDDYLGKPIELEALRKVLLKYCQPQESFRVS